MEQFVFRKPPPVRIAHRSRISHVTLEKGVLRVDGHCLLLQQETGAIELPGALASCLFIEPGVTVTHEAIKLCAENQTSLFWVGEGLTRLYSCAHAGPSPQRVLLQCRTHENLASRIAAARRVYEIMFGESPPSLTIEKLRGIEGSKVRAIYAAIAAESSTPWSGRDAAPADLKSAIGFATSCLYALTEVAILAAGYTPCIGIVHSGDPRSLVFDIADTVKFKTVVPLAFRIYQERPKNLNAAVRHACRDLFRTDRVFEVLLQHLYRVMGEETA